jgi:hypothetical protein
MAASPSGRSVIALLQAPPTAAGDASTNASLLVPAVKIDLGPAGGGEPTARARMHALAVGRRRCKTPAPFTFSDSNPRSYD